MAARLALITGASCGVGFALAEQFARRGYDLVIADGSDEIYTAEAALTVLGTDVQAEQVSPCCADSAYLLHRRVMAAGRPVAVAALTASVNESPCVNDTLDGALEMLDSCVRGTMLLARLQAQRMALRGHGGIILTASPPETMPGLSAAVYSASTAFLRAFAESLHDQVSGRGVKVTALMPEPIAAGGSGFTDMLLAFLGRPPTDFPAHVARHAMAALSDDDKGGIAAWATDTVTTLAGRFVAERVRHPARQIISPTGEAV